METPITQSQAWQQLQSDLGEASFFKRGKGYQYLAILKHTPVGNYLYLPYGPVYEDKSSFNTALESLQSLAREQSAIFIRVEPQAADFASYAPHTAKKSPDLNPKETWALTLTGKEEDLKTRLPSRLLRYHRSASKKGLRIETSHDPADIHHLLDLQRALASEKGINTFSEKYLQTELSQPFATLYLVKQRVAPDGAAWTGDGPGGGPPPAALRGRGRKVRQDPSRESLEAKPPEGEAAGFTERVVAAGLVFDDKHTRYNLQGAQSAEGRRLHATGILTIQLILDAKAKHLQTFDFWGIAPEDAPSSHPWAGFTAFKKTFAGQQVDYAGTYDIVLHPCKYHLYRTLRSLNKLIRKGKA